jgi:RNA polymerase sigma factor (sigma-70 family)
MAPQVSRRNALLFVVTVLFRGDSTAAFSLQTPLRTSITSTTQSSSAPRLLPRGSSSLHMAVATKRSSTTASLPRLTREEEMSLLRQTTELRRIKEVESDLTMQTSMRLKMPLLSIRAEAAGYGHDLELYQAAMDAGHEARETMVTRNIGLVHYCVNEIWKKQPKSRIGTLSREDLIQEGSIGLARAVDKYNIGIGGKFSSYAVYWIRAFVLRCIAEKGDLVRVPEHVSTAIRKMSTAANRLGLQIDGDTIVNDVFSSQQPWKDAQAAKVLAEEAGLTDTQLRQALIVKSRRRAGSVSFEDWMQNGQDLQSDVTSKMDSPQEASVDSGKLRLELSKHLNNNEMEALSLRFGLDTKEAAQQQQEPYSYQAEAEALVFGEDAPITTKRKKSGEMTFSEVGKQMSVSAEYGRRLVHKALAKLQKAAADGQLEPALLY